MTFVGTFYIELTMVAKFPPSQAWALVGGCVAAVFALMDPYRARVALLGDPRRLHDKAAYIWAVLQCHRVMHEFILLNFRGHPSVVKEMSLFMLTERVDPSEMDSLARKRRMLPTRLPLLWKERTMLLLPSSEIMTISWKMANG
jgi:hypothetical protein